MVTSAKGTFTESLTTGSRFSAVLPYVRIVPGGIERAGGRTYLLATVLITPDSEGATAKSPYRLSHWTGDVIRQIKAGLGPSGDQWTLPVQVVPAIYTKDPNGTLCRAKPETVSGRKTISAKAYRLKEAFTTEKRIQEADSLWRLSLTGTQSEDDGRWITLANAISRSLSTDTVRPGEISQSDDYKYQEPNLGQDGQISEGINTGDGMAVDTILTVRQADLALEIERQRVEELITSIREASGDQTYRADQEQVQITRQIRLMGEDADQTLSLDPDKTKITSKDIRERLAEKRKKQRRSIFESEGLKQNRADAHRAYDTARKDNMSRTCGQADMSLAWQERTTEMCPTRETERRTPFEKASDTHVYATWPQYSDEPEKQAGIEAPDYEAAQLLKEDELDKWAKQTFFTMQSTPTLSRLFGLAVDVRIDLEEALDHDGFNDVGHQVTLMDGAKQRFVFLCSTMGLKEVADHGGTIERALPWALAKLRHDGAPALDHFWPSTSEELALPPGFVCKAENTAQFEGYVVMGSGYKLDDTGVTPARFDLTSMDIRAATELETQRRNNRKSDIESADFDHVKSDNPFPLNAPRAQLEAHTARILMLKSEVVMTEASGENAFASTLQTAGLTLLDRGVQTQTARKLATKVTKTENFSPEATSHYGAAIGDPTKDSPKGHVVFDAEDFTIGFQLDTGMPVFNKKTEQSEVQWRGLSSRIISFGTSGLPSDETFDKTLPYLTGGWQRSAFRWMLDGAYFALPSRLLPNMGTDNLSTGRVKVESVVEEALTVWNGTPMGVDCIDELTATDPMGIEQKVFSYDTFPFGRTLCLPGRSQRPPYRYSPPDTSFLPPFLRYRRPYRFKMRAVYQGGLSVPPSGGADADVRLDGKLFYPVAPNDKVKPFFRYLRQDKIKSPQVLVRREDVKLHLMGPIHGTELVIRSIVGAKDKKTPDYGQAELSARAFPAKARRWITPPAVVFEDASQHSVFDNDSSSARPRGAYKGVVYDSANGGFPVMKTETRKGFNGLRHFLKLSVGFPSAAERASDDFWHGNSVFSSELGPRGNFYPDPIAHSLAIGLRVPGEKTYLEIGEGGPIYGAFWLPGAKYHDLKKLELTVEREGKRKNQGRPTLRDIAKAHVNFKGSTTITLKLEPGESYDVDLWCVPTAEVIAAEMSLVQSLAIYLTQHAGPAGNCTPDDCVEGIKKILGKALGEAEVDALAQAVTEAGADAGPMFIGPGGHVAPPTTLLLTIGELLRNIMLRHPIGDIAALTTVRATHAVERPAPAEAPALKERTNPFEIVEKFPAKPHDPAPLTIYRPSQNMLDLVSYKPNDKPKKHRAFPIGKTAIAPGSTEAVLSGSIDLALKVCDGFELVAEAALPVSSSFDDPKRGRSLEHRRAGEWPQQLSTDGRTFFRKAGDLFGFDVTQTGEISFAKQEVTLLRVEGLSFHDAKPAVRDGYWRIDLTDFILYDDDPDKRWRVTGRHVFPDGKARTLTVRARAFSRTVSKMEIPRQMNSDGVTFMPEKPIPYELSFATGNTVQVILPATNRPSICDVRSSGHVFKWSEQKDDPASKRVLTRTACIQIPLGRNWFSSGEDEKLGIVVWPPELTAASDEIIQHNLVPVPRVPGETPVIQALEDLIDSDLGPGGRYVTRMGGDPLRAAHPGIEEGGQDAGVGVLMHYGAFRDLTAQSDQNARAQYVSSVIMPIDEDPGDPNLLRSGQTLTVGLITYEPRFDVDSETWYVNVDIDSGLLPDPFIRFGLVRYQPHAPRELQVSRPAVHWAQILPRREVQVQLVEDRLKILVTGVAASDSVRIWRDLYPNGDRAKEEMLRSVPHMRFCLIHEHTTVDGLPLREVKAESSEVKKFGIPAKIDGQTSIWRADLQLLQPVPDTGKMYLHIEEIDWRRPAQYANEPLPISEHERGPDEVGFTESGPRFVASIRVDDLIREKS